MLKIENLYQPILGNAKPILNWLVSFRGTTFFGTEVALVDGAALAVDGSNAETFTITCANDGARAFQAPTNIPAGGIFRTQVLNTSGAPLTLTTWVAAYHGAPTLPATGKTRVQTWLWTGAVAYLVSESPADLTI